MARGRVLSMTAIAPVQRYDVLTPSWSPDFGWVQAKREARVR